MGRTQLQYRKRGGRGGQAPRGGGRTLRSRGPSSDLGSNWDRYVREDDNEDEEGKGEVENEEEGDDLVWLGGRDAGEANAGVGLSGFEEAFEAEMEQETTMPTLDLQLDLHALAAILRELPKHLVFSMDAKYFPKETTGDVVECNSKPATPTGSTLSTRQPKKSELEETSSLLSLPRQVQQAPEVDLGETAALEEWMDDVLNL